ncbi:MAG: hypothetical protein WDN46_09825 [Methylocella sp.]
MNASLVNVESQNKADRAQASRDIRAAQIGAHATQYTTSSTRINVGATSPQKGASADNAFASGVKRPQPSKFRLDRSISLKFCAPSGTSRPHQLG